MDEPEPLQRPEGALLAEALERSGSSTRQIAATMGLSDTRLRQIINGYQPLGRGQRSEVIGPAKTIARAAQALEIEPAELRRVGRDDAADALENLIARQRSLVPDASSDTDRILERLERIEQRLDDFEQRLPAQGPNLSAVAFEDKVEPYTEFD